MRTLEPAPADVIDPVTKAARMGSYRGSLPRVDLASLARSRLWRLAHEKRWMYVAISADPLLLGIAVADLGYLCNAFAFVFDRSVDGGGRMVADETALGPPLVGDVNDTSGPGHRAAFRLGSAEVSIARPAAGGAYAVDVRLRRLEVHAELGVEGAPPPISVVAPIPGGVVNTTEKRALLSVVGEAIVAGKRHTLDGGLGGYDYTHGLLARRTAWRWAFAQGQARGGERVGLNLVEGFVGEPECALWAFGDVHPLAEGRFAFDASRPTAPWKVRTADASVELEFAPGGAHVEHKNFGVIASRFIQPMGVFRGTIRLPGRPVLELEDVLGVTEDQDILW